MSDNFGDYSTSLTAPAANAVEITPDDNNDLAISTRGLWVGGAGNLDVIFLGDSASVTIEGIPAGTLLPFRVKKVLESSTASLIVGLY